MSEFKYACPVCGQHMMCDSSQAGSVMECPTCFQKITAPNAPASADQKFILTGSKVVEKKPTVSNVTVQAPPAAENKFLLAAAIVVVLVLAAGGAVLVHQGKIFKPDQDKKPPGVANPMVKAPVKPALIAPPANDTNWLLSLDAVTIPAGPVVGRIHGRDFISERAAFQNGVLALREGKSGTPDLVVTINFRGAPAESLSGQTINVSTNAEKAARLTLRWKDAGLAQTESYDAGYALRLEFGTLEKNRLPGKIYLSAPDSEKSYLLGSFNADARKPKPKAPKK